MGGINHVDHNIATYRTSIRDGRVFSFLVQVPLLTMLGCSIIVLQWDWETWFLGIDRAHCQSISSEIYIQPAQIVNIAYKKQVVPEVRIDHMDHSVESILKQRRCGHWGKKVSRQCRKYLLALHAHCLAAFHSQWTEMSPSHHVKRWDNGLWQYSLLSDTNIT